jgi:hypothetical protein
VKHEMLSLTEFCSLLTYVETKNCAQLGYRLDIQGHDKEKNILVYKTDILAPNLFVFSSLIFFHLSDLLWLHKLYSVYVKIFFSCN